MHSPEDSTPPVNARPSDAPAAAPAERELVEACQRGSLPAFEQLYHAHGPRMKSLALNLLGNVPDAEDAVQQTFLKAYRSAANFKGQSSFSTWMFRILINNCYDVRRKRQRRGGESAEVELDAEDAPVLPARASDHALRMALERSIARLRPRHRTVFLLAEVEGFSHQEIAGMLGLSEPTSKNLLFQAKRELREMLKRFERPAR